MYDNRNMTDGGISCLAKGCIHLQSINIGGYSSQLTDASLAAIGESCRGLTSIDMSDNGNMTDGGISCLAKGCIHLLVIGLRLSCDQLTDASLAAIGVSCWGLTSIDMSDNSNMTDGGISCLAQGCIHLQSINIGGSCSQLTDASLVAIGESCRGLTIIDMFDNRNMTDDSISYLAHGCIHLQSINIGGYSSQLTDASLAWHGCDSIGESCRGLTSIDMYDNSNITDGGISYLAQGCIHLQLIGMGSCSQLTDASLAWLR